MQYKTYGDKKNTPFLILHGWGGSSESWEEVGEMLGKNFYVIVPDIPCASKNNGELIIDSGELDSHPELVSGSIDSGLSLKGQSSCDKIYTLDDYADLIKSFIDELGLGNFILLGHSNGGAIATKLVINYPDLKLKKLILNNSAGIRKDRKRSLKRKVLGGVSKIVKPIFSLPGMGKVRNLFYRAIGGHDYLEAEKNLNKKQTYLNMINSDLQENYKDINIPTLLIWGENDTYTPLADGEKINNLIKNSKLVIIKDVKHGIHLQNPNELVKVILENNL